MTASELMKLRRAEAKAEGNCQKCFKREAMPDQALCGRCADLHDDYKESRKATK
jgi:hypothetical protein